MLMKHKEWSDLTSIPVPDDLKSLIRKCKRLNSDLQVMRLVLRNRMTFPNDYIISLRSQMLDILTSYLSFLKGFVKKPEDVEKIEKELQELITGLTSRESEVMRELGSKEKYFFNMQLYLNIYHEFIYSYIFNTLKEAEEEYAKGLRKGIADIMLRKVGILKVLPPIEEKPRVPVRVSTKPEVKPT